MKTGKKRDAAWLAFIMFAVGVFFMGFDNEWGFRIAGGFGIVVGAVAYLCKYEAR